MKPEGKVPCIICPKDYDAGHNTVRLNIGGRDVKLEECDRVECEIEDCSSAGSDCRTSEDPESTDDSWQTEGPSGCLSSWRMENDTWVAGYGSTWEEGESCGGKEWRRAEKAAKERAEREALLKRREAAALLARWKLFDPPWHTELSDIQMEAVNCLASALKADIEEGGKRRTIDVLSQMGVTPMPTLGQLKVAMATCIVDVKSLRSKRLPKLKEPLGSWGCCEAGSNHEMKVVGHVEHTLDDLNKVTAEKKDESIVEEKVIAVESPVNSKKEEGMKPIPEEEEESKAIPEEEEGMKAIPEEQGETKAIPEEEEKAIPEKEEMRAILEEEVETISSMTPDTAAHAEPEMRCEWCGGCAEHCFSRLPEVVCPDEEAEELPGGGGGEVLDGAKNVVKTCDWCGSCEEHCSAKLPEVVCEEEVEAAEESHEEAPPAVDKKNKCNWCGACTEHCFAILPKLSCQEVVEELVMNAELEGGDESAVGGGEADEGEELKEREKKEEKDGEMEGGDKGGEGTELEEGKKEEKEIKEGEDRSGEEGKELKEVKKEGEDRAGAEGKELKEVTKEEGEVKEGEDRGGGGEVKEGEDKGAEVKEGEDRGREGEVKEGGNTEGEEGKEMEEVKREEGEEEKEGGDREGKEEREGFDDEDSPKRGSEERGTAERKESEASPPILHGLRAECVHSFGSSETISSHKRVQVLPLDAPLQHRMSFPFNARRMTRATLESIMSFNAKYKSAAPVDIHVNPVEFLMELYVCSGESAGRVWESKFPQRDRLLLSSAAYLQLPRTFEYLEEELPRRLRNDISECGDAGNATVKTVRGKTGAERDSARLRVECRSMRRRHGKSPYLAFIGSKPGGALDARPSCAPASCFKKENSTAKKIRCGRRHQKGDDTAIIQQIICALKKVSEEHPDPIAGLPLAWKLPELKMWLEKRRRNNNPAFAAKRTKMTENEIKKLIIWSKSEWNRMQVTPYVLREPKTPAKLRTFENFNMNHFKFLRKEADKLRREYFTKFKRIVLEESKDYWPTMCPGASDSVPWRFRPQRPPPPKERSTFRRVYHAYLPAREKDVLI